MYPHLTFKSVICGFIFDPPREEIRGSTSLKRGFRSAWPPGQEAVKCGVERVFAPMCLPKFRGCFWKRGFAVPNQIRARAVGTALGPADDCIQYILLVCSSNNSLLSSLSGWQERAPRLRLVFGDNLCHVDNPLLPGSGSGKKGSRKRSFL